MDFPAFSAIFDPSGPAQSAIQPLAAQWFFAGQG
jgi:hypothetical protein